MQLTCFVRDMAFSLQANFREICMIIMINSTFFLFVPILEPLLFSSLLLLKACHIYSVEVIRIRYIHFNVIINRRFEIRTRKVFLYLLSEKSH